MNATGSVYVSGYTQAPYGVGPGLSRFSLAPDGAVGELLARGSGAVNASFAVLDGGALLTVEELPEGRIAAFDPLTLDLRGRTPSGGADPCHLLLRGPSVWAANYSSGTASVTPLAALLGTGLSGGTTPEPPVLLSHPGSGPVGGRQAGSHAHQVTATPWGTVLVSDLGADRVDEYSARSLVRLGSAELPPGAGPRHVAIKGEFLLVAGELDGHVHVLRRSEVDPHDGAGHFWKWLFRTPLAASAAAIAGDFAPSHIQLSADGTRLYAAVRGPNTLVVLDVAGLEAAGLDAAGLEAARPAPPALLAEVACGGSWPRHFAVGNNKMYVANQLSNNVAVFDLDGSGLPGPAPVQSVDFGSPTCVVLA